MPRQDGTGPQGRGPLTGGGRGECVTEATSLPEDGFGRRLGLGRRHGRGFGQGRGQGLGRGPAMGRGAKR